MTNDERNKTMRHHIAIRSSAVILMICLGMLLVSCARYERKVVPFKLPSAYENAVEVAGAGIATKAYDDPKEAKLPLLEVNEHLYIVPSDIRLRGIEDLLVTYGDPSRALSRLLKRLMEYFDYCFIDLPPSLGNLTKNAVFASDGVIIPIEAGQFSLNGVTNLVTYLDELKHDGDLKFDILGACMTKYDERKSISIAVKEQVSKYFKGKMFDTTIRINTDVEKAQANGEDIFMFAKSSNSAVDYGKLGDEIIARLNHQTIEV